MPLTDGHNYRHGLEHSFNDELEELSFNPFDDGASNRPFTSGRASSHTPQSVTRRRGDSESVSHPVRGATVHSRSRTTEDYVSDHRDHHPLSSRPTASFRHDANSSTRPRLARALSSWASENSHSDKLDRDGSSEASTSTSKPDESQRLVLVHEVKPKDSLAGVALKYGISLPELRRANQLWPSDPIHLRQVLYIPVDQARHAKLLFIDAAASASEQADVLQDEEHFSPSSVAVDPPPLSPPTSSYSPPRSLPSSSLYTIRRIPNSRLSFFPPSHSSHLTRSPQDRDAPRPHTASILDDDYFSPLPPPILPDTTSTSSNSNSNSLLSATSTLAPKFTPLFSALPFSASTRDEIISRLSFDSTSNSTSVSGEDEVELSSVGQNHTQTSRHHLPIPLSSSIPSPHTLLSTSPSRLRPKASTGDTSRRRGKRDKEEEHIPMGSPTTIRTVQMEPSPTMQLPLQVARSVSASSANLKRGWGDTVVSSRESGVENGG